MAPIAPAAPFTDVKNEPIPTAPGDIWSRRDLFLAKPTTGHEHLFRGDEWAQGVGCTGNIRYADVGVDDKHDLEGFGFNTSFGEHRQMQFQWGTRWTQLPPNPVHTLMVAEIKLEWIFITADTDTVAWPEGAGPVYGEWRWGLAYDMLGPNNAISNWQSLVVQYSNNPLLMKVRRGTTPANTWDAFPSGVGNVFHGILTDEISTASLFYNAHYEDLRLQMILRVMPQAGHAGHYAQYIDHYFTPDGKIWLYVGQKEIDIGTNPTQAPRLRRVIWGSGHAQNRALNPTSYYARRLIDHCTLLWMPVKQPSQFVWVQ